MNITSNERIALDMIARNTYQPANGGRPDTFDDTAPIWSKLITDTSAAASLTGRTISATCASLAKKGLVTTTDASPNRRRSEPDDSTISLTEAGFAAWLDAFPPDALPGDIGTMGHLRGRL